MSIKIHNACTEALHDQVANILWIVGTLNLLISEQKESALL